MKKLNNKGFGLVQILLVIVIIGLIAGVGYYVYSSQKKTNTALENAANSQPDPQKTNKEVTQGEKEETDPNEGYLVVKEWGLRFKVPDGLSDVKYAIHGETVVFYAKPTGYTVEYRSDYDNTDENNYSRYATGKLYRSNESTKDKIGIVVEGKKLGDYYYYTSWAFSSLATGAACVGLYGDAENCEPEGIAFKLVNQGDTALLNTIELAQ